MNKRKVAVSLGIILMFAIVFWLSGLGTSGKAPAASEAKTPKLRRLQAVKIKNKRQLLEIPITGKIKPDEKIDVYAEVQGKLLRSTKPFKEGLNYRKGEAMIVINSEEAALSLRSQKSTFLNALVKMMPDLKMDFPDDFGVWDRYLQDYNISQPLQPLPGTSVSKLKYFLASRNIYDQYYSIKSQEKNLSKYIIKAPFNGTVVQSLVNPGALVSSQMKLGEFSSTESYELEAAVSLTDLKYVKTGDKVKLKSNNLEGSWTGKVKRINKAIDPSSQNISIFIQVTGENILEGMFLEGIIVADESTGEFVAEISRDMITRNNQVYVVEDSLVRLSPIVPIRYLSNTVWVKGL